MDNGHRPWSLSLQISELELIWNKGRPNLRVLIGPTEFPVRNFSILYISHVNFQFLLKYCKYGDFWAKIRDINA